MDKSNEQDLQKLCFEELREIFSLFHTKILLDNNINDSGNEQFILQRFYDAAEFGLGHIRGQKLEFLELLELFKYFKPPECVYKKGTMEALLTQIIKFKLSDSKNLQTKKYGAYESYDTTEDGYSNYDNYNSKFLYDTNYNKYPGNARDSHDKYWPTTIFITDSRNSFSDENISGQKFGDLLNLNKDRDHDVGYRYGHEEPDRDYHEMDQVIIKNCEEKPIDCDNPMQKTPLKNGKSQKKILDLDLDNINYIDCELNNTRFNETLCLDLEPIMKNWHQSD